MSENIEKDCTKSISWLALTNSAQKRIVAACLKRKELTMLMDEKNEMPLEDAAFYDTIHEELGSKTTYPTFLNSKLERLLFNSEGGIFDAIQNYVTKFREIEAAAVSIAQQERSNTKNVSNINL